VKTQGSFPSESCALVTAASQPIATATASVLLSCYDDLRGNAVEADVEAGHGVGLALFIRSGMASWMQACASFAQSQGEDRRKSPPREGPALLQGLVVCGLCGGRMTVRYYRRVGRLVPNYLCQKAGIERGEPICQAIPGALIDEAVGGCSWTR
jgi:Recombinase zinc beta ribbon domain